MNLFAAVSRRLSCFALWIGSTGCAALLPDPLPQTPSPDAIQSFCADAHQSNETAVEQCVAARSRANGYAAEEPERAEKPPRRESPLRAECESIHQADWIAVEECVSSGREVALRAKKAKQARRKARAAREEHEEQRRAAYERAIYMQAIGKSMQDFGRSLSQPTPVPVSCTSNRVGDMTFTHCR